MSFFFDFKFQIPKQIKTGLYIYNYLDYVQVQIYDSYMQKPRQVDEFLNCTCVWL